MTADDLRFELRAPDRPVPLGGEVEVEIVLVNRGSRPRLVNTRLLAAPPHTPEAFREVTVEVDGPPGYVNRKVLLINAGRPRSRHFAELKPGESVVKTLRLTRLESMDLPGTYTVRATYRNTVADPALPERPWVGTVTSDRATIERI